MSATSSWSALDTRYVDVEQLTLDVDAPVRSRPTRALSGGTRPPSIAVAGRVLRPTAVFDTYWRFAAERQAIYEARLSGRPRPWTDDPVLAVHRFTNCYRAADRVSQYLIGQVLYRGSQDPVEVVFRTMLFKFFNRIQTWELLTAEVDEPTWHGYDFARYDQILGGALARGERLYSAAYVMPPPRLGEVRKHSNHLKLIELMMASGLPDRVASSPSLGDLFHTIQAYPAMGPFLAFQIAIDLNYSSVVDHAESEFVAAGPGAKDGIEKCFGRGARGIETEIIRYMTDHQEEHFARLGLDFHGLGGSRPLQLIDCQNLFCEVDKYARVMHPDIAGISGRTRIKQRYRYDTKRVPAWFPPKWGINGEVERSTSPHTLFAARFL